MNKFQPLISAENIRPLLLLLELLTVIPEEFSTILLNSQRRNQVENLNYYHVFIMHYAIFCFV